MAEIKSGNPSDVKRAGKEVPRTINYIVLILLILLFLCWFVNLNIFVSKVVGVESLPGSIRAGSKADYSQDKRNYLIPPINEKILNQIITENPATGSPQDRLGTLQAVLANRVPTMTPDLLSQATSTQTVPRPTSTLFVKGPTPTAFATLLPTATLIFQPSPTITIPPNPTFTSVPSRPTKRPKLTKPPK